MEGFSFTSSLSILEGLLTIKSIKISIYIFLVATLFFGQDLSKPKGGGVLDIITIMPSEGYSDMVFEGQISGYGSVYVAGIDSSKNRDTLDGQAKN